MPRPDIIGNDWAGWEEAGRWEFSPPGPHTPSHHLLSPRYLPVGAGGGLRGFSEKGLGHGDGHHAV